MSSNSASAARSDIAAALARPSARRGAFLTVATLTTVAGVAMMTQILMPNGLTVIEGAILVLFAVTFGFTALSFWTAAAGFVLRLFDIEPLTLRRRRAVATHATDRIVTRTAIVMPICDEDTVRVLAGVEATWRSLEATGEARHFDYYLLSDTRIDEIARAEERGWTALCRRLGAGGRIFYRRREERVGRKAGNIEDFCCRWGGHYEHMIVLDADSVMAGETLLALVRAMQADPKAGIVQSPPVPVRQETAFGRYVQFAAQLHGPMLTTGLSFWQRGEANYWGHNAIIRIAPFMEHCGLPKVPGAPPMGGEILSHDFVEAALMRRAGWRVYLLDDLGGSYEEVPSNIADYAKRDQRWAQGNLQHLRLTILRGLHPVSRLNFLLGALAYGSSLVWLLLLTLGTADALIRALVPHDFFRSGYQLYPDWPIIQTGKIYLLLAITIGMLVLPKVWGVTICLLDRDQRTGFGGAVRVIANALVELVFSVLLAPLMMTAHAYFVMTTLAGRIVSWGRQSREGRSLGFGEAVRFGAIPTLLGIGWGAATWIYAPEFFWWLTPVIAGLVMSIPLLMLSSLPGLGRRLAALGLFRSPEESRPSLPLQYVDRALAELPRRLAYARASARPIPQAPVPIRAPMQAQPFDAWSLRGLIRRRKRRAAPVHPQPGGKNGEPHYRIP